MKTTLQIKIKTIALACALSITSFAQDITVPTTLQASEKTMMLESVSRNGFAISVQGDKKDIYKGFEDYLEDTYKFKLKSGGGLVRGEELKSASISDKTFKLMALVQESGSGNELQLWIAFGTDIYVNSQEYATESNNAKAILKDYVKFFYSEILTEQIEDQNKVVSKITDDLDGFQDDKGGAEKTMAKAESKLAKSDAKIKKLEAKMKSIEESIKDVEQTKTDFNNTIEEAKKKKTEAENSIEATTTTLNVQKKSQTVLNTKLQEVKNL